ncbi:MAG: dihydroorotase [Chitinophagaceae bacterium]
MKILLKQVFVASKTSSHANKIVDILIENGIITSIENNITHTQNITVINCNNCSVTNGFVDVFCQVGEPGFEAKETLETLADAAFAGGFTTVFAMPNTHPIVDNKSLVGFIQSQNKKLPSQILPLGSITQKTEGKLLAEMYDMHQAGAVGFSDGLVPVQTAGVMLKALQYIKAFDGIAIQVPIDKSIGAKGVMNEGITSVQLGLQGIPSIGEELLLKRDIDLLEYTNSKLHVTGVSTKAAVNLIAAAKQKGLQITCSCTPLHLLFCEDDLEHYNTNLKLNPPLRTKADKEALQQALMDGVIDCIASHHIPEIKDNKICDFIEAAFGSINIQTVFSTLITAMPNISASILANVLVENAASIFKLNLPAIEVGNPSNLTVFNTTDSWHYSAENNKSKSVNSPLLNSTLKGKIVACINNHQVFIH